MTRAWRVDEEDSGERVDRFLTRRLELSRSQVQRWIRAGHAQVDGEPVKPSHRLSTGEEVEWEPLREAADPEILPEPGPLVILHQDPDLAVLDKPADLVVHPGAGRSGGTLANRLLQHFPETAGVGGPGRPGIVHRLDKDTTGVMVVARTPAAYLHLTEAFAERRVEKRYLALVHGEPGEKGTVEEPIARHPVRRREMAARPGGRPARTDYRRLATAEGLSLLELDLKTGRTHQIRVHLKAMGHPLVGDPVYGEARWRALPPRVGRPLASFPRPALHAWTLAFPHPRDRRRVDFTAPVPDDLLALWQEVSGRPFPVPLAG